MDAVLAELPAGEAEPADPDYGALAELRYRIRRFLASGEKAARDAGLGPQQHQVLLTIKGLPVSSSPTINVLAERLAIRHHTMVELIDRMVVSGLVRRERRCLDRRQVQVALTPAGQRILPRSSSVASYIWTVRR